MATLDPGKESGSTWSYMNRGTHERIASILDHDIHVTSAMQNLLSNLNDIDVRTSLIDIIVRETGNCIGQAVIQELDRKHTAELKLDPSDGSKSMYCVMDANTVADIVSCIKGNGDAQTVLGGGNPLAIVRSISRMTGRCIGQELDSAIDGLFAIVSKLISVGK